MRKLSLNDDFIFWFIMIDIFLLPYFNIVVIPLSYFFIIYWVIQNRTAVKKSIDHNGIVICLTFMTVSTLWGTIMNWEYSVASDNIKRLLQYGISFEYLIFFRYYLGKKRPNLKMILYCFVVFVVGLAILFQISPSLYSTVCSLWNRGNSYISSSFLENVSFGYNLRYGFIWTDQNNIAYALTGVILFMLIYFRVDVFEIVILFFANIYVLLCSMSSGGWISFAISWGCYVVYKLLTLKKPRFLVSKKAFWGSVIVVVLVIALANSGVLTQFLESNLVESAIDRFENNDNSRTEIWIRILNEESIFLHMLIGNGSTIIINSINRAAHSGHIYWIYAYGFISYFIFMKKLFWFGVRKIWKYVPVISFFLCFTMNTMVGEQKLLLIYILIVALLREVDKDDYSKRNYSDIQCG